MALSNLELYEALKKSMDEDAARMIAEVVPLGRDVATKDDIARVEKATGDQIAAVQIDIARVEQQLARMEARFARWILTFFVPLWITSAAAIVTALVAG